MIPDLRQTVADADAAYASAAADDDAADDATPTTPPDGRAEPHPTGWSLHGPPALGAGAGAARGGLEGW
jgi:hypothetical protein